MKINCEITQDMQSKTQLSLVVAQDSTYNIPVCLWLEDSYPQTPPLCYVRPTKEMMIVRGHYTSSNGEVELPYLEEWKSVRNRNMILYSFTELHCKEKETDNEIRLFLLLPSGWVWPGEPPAGDAGRVRRLPSCVHADSLRAGARLV